MTTVMLIIGFLALIAVIGITCGIFCGDDE